MVASDAGDPRNNRGARAFGAPLSVLEGVLPLGGLVLGMVLSVELCLCEVVCVVTCEAVCVATCAVICVLICVVTCAVACAVAWAESSGAAVAGGAMAPASVNVSASMVIPRV